MSESKWLERNPKKVLFVLVLVVIIGLALLTEKVLVWESRPIVYRGGSRRFINLREHSPNYRGAFIPLTRSDSQVRKKYIVRVDENGFLMPSKVHKNPDLVIVFLGGSTTECLYMEEEHRFAYLTGRLLEKKLGLRVNSYNGGRGGNNSLHSLNTLLDKVIPMHPNIVVMMHNINDLTTLIYEKTYWNHDGIKSPILEKKPTFGTVLGNFKEDFRLILDITVPNLSRKIQALFSSGSPDEFAQVRGKKITIDRTYLVKEFSLNLQTFIDLCRVRGIVPVLMTMESRLKDQPDEFIASTVAKLKRLHGISYQEFKEAFDLMNQTIREVGIKNRVPVIDLAKEVPPEKDYLVDITHFSDFGSRYAAGLISESLAPIVQNTARH